MLTRQFSILVFCYFLISSVCALNILVFMPVRSGSHYFTFKPIVEKLAERNHNVTFIVPFEQKPPIKNLEYITLKLDPNAGNDANLTENSQFGPAFSFTDLTNMFGAYGTSDFMATLVMVWAFLGYSRLTCVNLLDSPEMHQFLAEDRKFDLLIGEAFHTNCFMGLVDRYQAPLVLFTSSAAVAWYHEQFGLPNNPSYIPNLYSGLGTKMNFGDRVKNVILNEWHTYYFKNIQEPINFELAKNVFGENLQDFDVTVRNSTLLLVNSHFSIMGSRPMVPSVVEIGGIHIGTAKMLPKNIEKWINESKDGVIYFSMGSMIKGHTFPEEKRKVFLRAFGRLKQRVLWKWENETMPDKPDNVMIQKWMPQFDILSHPNVKAFISHGGLLGTTEAVHCGVPVVVMPQFGDQHTNARALEAGGGGVVLNFREADEEMVYNALKKVLDPEFNKKAKELSARFRDRPMSPMDTAIYWIEYVARHKGAHHLRTAAVGMPLYQYLLLDVFGFLALCVLSALFVAIFIAKMLLRFVKSLFSSGDKKQKKQKKQ